MNLQVKGDSYSSILEDPCLFLSILQLQAQASFFECMIRINGRRRIPTSKVSVVGPRDWVLGQISIRADGAPGPFISYLADSAG